MGDYADIKRRKFEKGFLKWLKTKEGICIDIGGKHNIKIKHPSWNIAFPIPFRHNVVNKYIVKDLMKKLVDANICTKEEFDENI